jgi:hypothetical protein
MKLSHLKLFFFIFLFNYLKLFNSFHALRRACRSELDSRRFLIKKRNIYAELVDVKKSMEFQGKCYVP